MNTTELHIVTGDTFKHKDAIKSAGGKWDGKHWIVPAGAKLPDGVTTVSQSAHRAENSPAHAEIGGRVVRPTSGRDVAVGTVVSRDVLELEVEDGKKVPVYAELHQTSQNGYIGHRVAAYYQNDAGKWAQFDADHATETMGYRPYPDVASDAEAERRIAADRQKAEASYAKMVAWLKGGE